MSKRDKILAAALPLFAERGFHSTPTSAISKAAGVSAGILYHYFDSKEELIYSLYRETKLDFLKTISNGLGKVQNLEGEMRLIWSNGWNYGIDHPNKFRFIQQFHHSPFSQKIKDDGEVQSLAEGLMNLVREGIATGTLKDIHIELHMVNTNFLIVSLVELITQNPELKTDKTFIEQAWECYWDCIHK